MASHSRQWIGRWLSCQFQLSVSCYKSGLTEIDRERLRFEVGDGRVEGGAKLARALEMDFFPELRAKGGVDKTGQTENVG